MSILDGMPENAEQMKAAIDFANPIIEKALADLNLGEKAKDIIDLMKEGVPLKAILNITDNERDALFLQACRSMQFGEREKARQALVMLHLLDPLDARVLYVLGGTYQAENNLKAAAQFYVHFLALDATNADGYMRLGECFLASKEYDMAEDTFKIALSNATKNGASEKTIAYARQMIDVVKSQRAGKAN